MPYRRLAHMPDPVKNHLPTQAQKIYLAAFNDAGKKHTTRANREPVAHRVA